MKKYFNFNTTYDKMPDILYTYVNPSKVSEPKLLYFNKDLAKTLGIEEIAFEKEEILANIFTGNFIQEGSKPLAMAYAGHQFGHFTMLGDGRAILLGEQVSPDGSRYDIQLKGSGCTRYSRNGDGKAALSPVLREYLISEAMYKLGIKSTRTLAVCTTGESVYREKKLDGAILTRVASSHIRVGTFQFAAIKEDKKIIKELASYTLYRLFPECADKENPFLEMFREICRRQAKLISEWMRVGFVHGVMNTDNMSIVGETIDYGPCAFMDKYSPDTVFSSIDVNGRYRFGQQISIASWNLARLAEAFLPLFDGDRKKLADDFSNEISSFVRLFEKEWIEMMAKKLGFLMPEFSDIALIERLLGIMYVGAYDYNNTFIYLRHLLSPLDFDASVLMPKDFEEDKDFKNWVEQWKKSLEEKGISAKDAISLMEKNNPIVIPRNHKLEEALQDAVNGQYIMFDKLFDILSRPYDYTFKDLDYMSVPMGNDEYVTYCGT